MNSRTPFALALLASAAILQTSCGPSGPVGEQFGKFTVIDTLTDEADRSIAKKNAENTLLKYPDIDAMVGLYAYNAPMCLEALKDAGRVGEVKLFSFDEDTITLQGISDGNIEGTVVQQPYEFGYQAIRYLNMIHEGQEFEVPENKEIDIPARTITSDNVTDFQARLAELRELGEQAAKAPKPDADKKFAFITNVVDPFWTYAQAGCFMAQQEFNAVVDFEAPPTGKVDEQNKILENVEQGGYDGVALSPLDPLNQVDLINRIAGKMPFICHDSDAPDSERLFYLGTNNYEAGRMLGKLVKERMPDGGEIMIYVGKIDMLNAQQRRQGLLDELAAE